MWHLLCERAKETIPYNEDHPHVAVEIRDITGMMNAVVRRRNKNILYPAGKFFYGLGMHQYAIYLCNGVHEYCINRFEVEQYKRNKIQVLVYRHEYRRPEPG